MTFSDLKEILSREEELTILELLDLTSVELVEILESFIYDKQDELQEYYGQESADLD